jgi:predicted lipid-binding transport protein (Tim44 family)
MGAVMSIGHRARLLAPPLSVVLAALGLALAVALGLADQALAQAGRGSGGFGGGSSGGGGSGGGGFGGSGGRRGGGGFGGLLLVLVFLVAAIFIGVGAVLQWRKIRRRHVRVHSAAAEAATDDSYLAAELVEREGGELYLATQQAWDDRDREALRRLVGDDLMVEWSRRLDDFDRRGWHNRVKVTAAPTVRYVSLVNRADDADDRVVVLISASMQAYVETADGQRLMQDREEDASVSMTEYWTLARNDDRWIVVSIEGSGEGAHHLDATIVAVPEADVEGLRDETVTELAGASAVPEGFTTADLAVVDFDGTAREEALDLSLADGRFAPDVLEVAARRAVAAWAGAVDGADAQLEAVASPEAVQTLLHGDDTSGRTRLVVRGPSVRLIRIAAVRAAGEPALMDVEIEVSARRYVEDRDTTDLISGSRDSATQFVERWTFALDGPVESPWRLVDAHGVRAAG